MNILIVASGSPPSSILLHSGIDHADLVLAVDGGFDAFQEHGLKPDTVLGDMDSIGKGITSDIGRVHLPDQEYTDLEKTLQYVLNKHTVRSIVLLGAGGQRTDHLLHNLEICGSIDPGIKITIKNELSHPSEYTAEFIQRITPQSPFDLRVRKDDTLSILPLGNFRGLSSNGLLWEIMKANRSENFMSQSNIALKDDPQFSIEEDYAYIAVYQ